MAGAFAKLYGILGSWMLAAGLDLSGSDNLKRDLLCTLASSINATEGHSQSWDIVPHTPCDEDSLLNVKCNTLWHNTHSQLFTLCTNVMFCEKYQRDLQKNLPVMNHLYRAFHWENYKDTGLWEVNICTCLLSAAARNLWRSTRHCKAKLLVVRRLWKQLLSGTWMIQLAIQRLYKRPCSW